MKRLNLVLPLVVLGLIVAGCSGDSQGPQADSKPNSSSPTPSGASEPAPEGAIADLTGECKANGKSWSFAGQLNNSSQRPATYHVTISVVTKQGSTVQASADQKFKVAAGKKQKITLGPVKVKAKSDSLACVPTVTVERG